MAPFRRAWSAALLVSWLAAPAEAAVRHVLLLQSLDRGNLTLDSFTGQFRLDLDARSGEQVTITQFVVNPAGFDAIPEEASVRFLQSAYADRPKPNLVMTVGGSAAAFARKYRQQLFPGVPRLFAALDHSFLRSAPLADDEAAVAVANDAPGHVADILQLFPGTSTVFVVLGSGSLGRFWRAENGRLFQERFGPRVNFLWSDEMSFSEVLRRVGTLPPRSAIYYITFGMDAQGGAYTEDRVLAEIRNSSNAPLFGAQSVELGHGIVGGRLMRIDDVSRKAADAAFRILNGASPASVRWPVQERGAPMFDWRELRRWGVDERRLPPGSAVLFRPPSLWATHREEVLLALAALLLQALLIAGLLYQRRARRRAELESRNSLAMAADASRRVTMSALTGSIAHELSQPLTAVQMNAQAAELLVENKRATLEKLREILADIRTENLRATEIIERHRAMLKSRELDKAPIDIHDVVRESVALVAHDMTARKIQVDVDVPPAPCPVVGDRVLLQQVLVNLMMNAMEAMAGTPPERRRVTVQNQISNESVVVSVRDAGTGLGETVDGQLFEPFVTTKQNGLGIGLTIARSIAHAHGGRMAAHNNPDGGATFTLTLPHGGAA